MIVKRTILVLMGLALAICSAGAIDISASTISNSNSGWLIANNGVDQTIITIYVMEPGMPNVPVPNANVTFALAPASAGMGTLAYTDPLWVTTGADGKATAKFTTSTKSGNASIIATVSYNDGMTTPIQLYTFQRIDHDVPNAAVFHVPPSLTVGSETNVNVTLTDRWGNRVDNKNSPESVRLFVLDDGTNGLKNGGSLVSENYYTNDNEGNVTAVYRLSNEDIVNFIFMDSIGSMVLTPYGVIQGVAGPVVYISQTIPSPNSLAADGTEDVEIYYYLMDTYGNEKTGSPIYMNSTDGKEATKLTEAPWGSVWTSFGPKDTIGHYTLIAVSLENTSAVCQETGTVGYCSQVIEFYNTDPVDLAITANPSAMPSLDSYPQSKSKIQAKVMDIKGNPVIGEDVLFTITSVSYPGGPFNETAPPVLSGTHAQVGSGGYATVDFTPGSFALPGSPGYVSAATGRALVTASWTDPDGNLIERPVTLEYKNYPYVSVSTLSACNDVMDPTGGSGASGSNNIKVGDNLNITIQLKGDGTALRPKPINSELLMDTSGSMDDSPKIPGPSGAQYKIFYAKLAGTTFVDSMDQTTDEVGLTDFNYSATLKYPLSNNFDAVKGTINSLPTSGNTNLRMGLKVAIDDIKDHSTNPNAIKAILVLTDGAYNSDGDPLARKGGAYIKTAEWSGGTDGGMNWYEIPGLTAAEQNMATYANESNIRLYTITLGNDTAIQKNYVNGTSSFQIYNTMDILASSTGGRHYHAQNGNELLSIYTDIAGQLKETAGGNTVVGLNFGTIKINDGTTEDIRTYMDYVFASEGMLPVASDSTYINKTWNAPDGYYFPLHNETRDDTASWAARSMAFNVGTIKLNETWTATFRLKLNKAGKIDLFGPDNTGSFISFTDSSTNNVQTSYFPEMHCNIKQSVVDVGFGDKILFVENLSFIPSGVSDPNMKRIQWNTTYNGEQTVTETIEYRVLTNNNGQAAMENLYWKTIPGTSISDKAAVFEQTDNHDIDISDSGIWPLGQTYEIRIKANARDAGERYTRTLILERPIPDSGIYIKLD